MFDLRHERACTTWYCSRSLDRQVVVVSGRAADAGTLASAPGSRLGLLLTHSAKGMCKLHVPTAYSQAGSNKDGYPVQSIHEQEPRKRGLSELESRNGVAMPWPTVRQSGRGQGGEGRFRASTASPTSRGDLQ